MKQKNASKHDKTALPLRLPVSVLPPLRDILEGTGIGLAVVFLCFRSLLFIPAALLFIPFWSGYRSQQKNEQLRLQLQSEFKNVTSLLYSSTAAGATLDKAIRDSLYSMKNTPDRYPVLIPEFERIILQLDRNVPMETALAQFAARCDDEDIHNFVRILEIAGRKGGQLPQIVENTSRAISQKMEISQQIRVLLAGGQLPGAAYITALTAYLNNTEVRKLTDTLTVLAPTESHYDVTLTYYINESDKNRAGQIQTSVNEAVADYILWQRSRIGRDINPDELVQRVKAAGAKRVVITSPVYTAVNDESVAICTSQTVTYGGLEDD